MGLTAFGEEGAALASPPATQFTTLGDGVAIPAYASGNPSGAFQDEGLGVAVDYATSLGTSFTTGIPVLGATFSTHWIAAQLAAAYGSGFVSAAPGLGFQIGSLQLGVTTNLQFNSFNWNNARAFAQWRTASGWSLGARAGIAVVTGGLDEATFGVGRSWGWLQTVLELQADGTFGTFRLWPGIGAHWGPVELGVSGAVARTSVWSFYADLLRVSAALHLGRAGFIRAYYETPYVAGLGGGVTF